MAVYELYKGNGKKGNVVWSGNGDGNLTYDFPYNSGETDVTYTLVYIDDDECESFEKKIIQKASPECQQFDIFIEVSDTILESETGGQYTVCCWTERNGEQSSDCAIVQDVTSQSDKINSTLLSSSDTGTRLCYTYQYTANDVERNRYREYKAVCRGEESDTASVIQPAKNVVILPEFDYLTFIYRWTDDSGRDLDTATVVLDSGIPGLDNKPLGFSCVGNNDSIASNYIKWPGDNTGTGTESACIYLGDIVDNVPSSTRKITIGLYGNWYGSIGNGEISMEYYTYKGGTMSAPSSAGGLYTNNGGEEVSHDTANVTVTSTVHAGCNVNQMTLIGMLEYDIESKLTIFSTY